MRRCGVVLVAIAAALLWAPPGAGAAAVDWGECPIDGLDPRQECALLTVPRDYRAPSGPTIEIAVSRIRTADPASRRGVLLYNPGGPGESGLDAPTWMASALPKSVQERYDLVSFDPRGVAYSSPASCSLAPEDLDVHKFIPYPDRDLDIGENVDYAKRAAAGCAATSGNLLPHITTANTARDMDRIRAALGEPAISYLGTSYGTYLGAVYAQMFPERTDRFILDSVVHPDRIWREMFASWGYAVELAFTEYTRYAAAHHETYGLGATPEAVYAKTLELIAELEAEPFVWEDGTLITGEFFRELIRNGLRWERSIPDLAAISQIIDARDRRAVPSRAARALVASGKRATSPLAPASTRRSTAGRQAAFPTIPDDNAFSAPWAIVCGDADWPSDPFTYQADVRAYDRLFPIHGRAAANIWPCAFWAFEPREPAPTIGALRGPGKALLVQSIRDPATPYDGAAAMRAALGARSSLLSVETGGHFISFTGKNVCADGRVERFLLTGTLSADAFCPRDAPIGEGRTARRGAEPATGGLLPGA